MKLNIKIVIFLVCLMFVTTLTSAYTFLDNFYSTNPTQAVISKDLGCFSSVPKEFKLVKSFNLLGLSGILAEGVKNKQKIGIVNTGIFFNVTKQTIENNIIDQQLKNLNSQIPFQLVNLQNLNVLKKGSFVAKNQRIPYIKLTFNLAGTESSKFEGIIGVIESKNKKNNLIFSINNFNKYNQKLTEKFIKSVVE